MRQQKRCRKAASMLLVAAMLFSAMGTAAFASGADRYLGGSYEDAPEAAVPAKESAFGIVSPKRYKVSASGRASVSSPSNADRDEESNGFTEDEDKGTFDDGSDDAFDSSDPAEEGMSDAASPSNATIELSFFEPLDAAVAIQTVAVGSSIKDITFPKRLKAFHEDEREFSVPVSWEAETDFLSEAEGTYLFLPKLPKRYKYTADADIPSIEVFVSEAAMLKEAGEVYTVGTPDEYMEALKKIEASASETATILLTSDINVPDRNAETDDEIALIGGKNPEGENAAGVVGKHITFISEGDNSYSINLSNDLQGDITLGNVDVPFQNKTVFANGNLFETTEAYTGKMEALYGGGNKEDVSGDTNLILRGGQVTFLYGGGYDALVDGDVSIIIDGPNVRIDTLYGGGHADKTASGKVSGNVTIDMREGQNGSFFGGGNNRYATDDKEGDREPAGIKGTVTVTLGYEGAPDKTVRPGTAMFVYAGSYHSTVGNTVLNVTDGFTSENSAGDRNIFGCGYNDTVLGTVKINIYGNPDMGSSFIYGGGNTSAGGNLSDNWPVRILNQGNEADALHISYDVPNETETGHGINAGSNDYIPMTVNGTVRVELIDGNMDFLVLDNENPGNLTVKGNSEIFIHGGRAAQVQGNQLEYASEETDYVTTVKLTGESEIGYFYRFDDVVLANRSKVLVDATKFPQFRDPQKPFFSVDNLTVDSEAVLTTQNNGQARILNSVVLMGTWEQAYDSGKLLPDDAARTDADLRIGGSMTVEGGSLISKGTTHVYNRLSAENGTLVFMNPAIVGMSASNGNLSFSVKDTKIYLPVIAVDDDFYPVEDKTIRLGIGQKATGNAEVYLFEGDDYTDAATITDGHVGQNYINAQRNISDAAFTLMADGGYYFKRENDKKTVDGIAYDMWQIAKKEISEPKPPTDPSEPTPPITPEKPPVSPGGGGGGSSGGGGGSSAIRPGYTPDENKPQPGTPQEETLPPVTEIPSESEAPGDQPPAPWYKLPIMGDTPYGPGFVYEEKDKVAVEAEEKKEIIEQLAALYAENKDLQGWLTMPGTGFGYPVMCSPENPFYYQHHTFKRQKDGIGIPFVGPHSTAESMNTLIHGHNMRNVSQFGQIWNYREKSFYEKHRYIDFKTLYDADGRYEVMAVFFAPQYAKDEEGVFHWYQYIGDMNKNQFDYYVENVKAMALYDTGVTAEYGDKLITLETCASTTDSTRLVVVAKKVKQTAE